MNLGELLMPKQTEYSDCFTDSPIHEYGKCCWCDYLRDLKKEGYPIP